MYSDFLVLWAAPVTDWKTSFSCIFSCIHHHISIDGDDDGDDYDDDDDAKLNNNRQTPCLVIFTKGFSLSFQKLTKADRPSKSSLRFLILLYLEYR